MYDLEHDPDYQGGSGCRKAAMGVWGELIAAGFAMGGAIGALIRAGALSGRMVDRPCERAAVFGIGVTALSAKLAKADGKVTREEVDAFKRIFDVPRAGAKEVARVYDQARRAAAGFEPYARQLADLFRDYPAAREQILEALFAVAAADGKVHRAERAFLERVADIFDLKNAAIMRRAPENDIDPWEALGVAPDAPDAEIKARYRDIKARYFQLAREYHPDRQCPQGDPECVKQATANLAASNAGWESIHARCGIG